MKLFKTKQRYLSAWTNSNRPLASSLACAVAMSAMLPAASVQAQGFDALEEVVVTARKREETLQEVPVAVTALTENSIANNRIEGISDLGSVVPGLVTGNISAGTAGSIYLRGVGTGAGNPTFDQAVAINIDGVGISSTQLMNAGMFDLQQIEVLRGPQALFYGKNSPGGVIALHTKDPGEELEVQATAHYETETEETAFRGIVSGPITDTLGGRLSVGWSESDEPGIDIENEDVDFFGTQVGFETEERPLSNENLFVMGTLAWEAGDNTSVNFKYAHLKNEEDGSAAFHAERVCAGSTPNFVNVIGVVGSSDCKVNGVGEATSINPILAAADPLFPGVDEGFSDTETDFASLNVTVDLTDEITLTSVTGYFENESSRYVDSSYEPVALLGNSAIDTLEQWSQEIRINTAFDGSVNFAGGLFYEQKDVTNTTSVTGPGGFGPLVPLQIGLQTVDTEATAYSAFGQVNWEMSDQWTLAAGLRYSYEEKEGAIDIVGASAITGGAITDDHSVELVESDPHWENVSPEATLSYHYSDDIMFFGSYKTAFKSGGIDGAYQGASIIFAESPYEATYDEETIVGFEVGMKSTLLDGTLRFNVTAYSFDYEDMQLSSLAITPFGPSLTTFNAGKATVEGIELETIWVTPVEGLTLTANLALSDSQFDEYTGNCIAGQTQQLGCNVDTNSDGIGDGVDMAGEQLPNSSDVSGTLGVDYLVSVGDNWNLGLNLSTSYKSEYNPSANLVPDQFMQDAYWLTNASISLFSADDTWEFYVRAVNLGDEYYTTNIANVPGTSTANNGQNDPTGVLEDSFAFVDGGRELTLGFTYRM